MIVLDASVLIAHLDAADRHHEHAEALLLAATEEDLGASTLTLAEVLVAPARAGRLDAAEAALRDLGVDVVALPGDAAPRLARLRADTGLRLPDCCVLLAARQSGAALATFDDRQAAAARDLGIAVHKPT